MSTPWRTGLAALLFALAASAAEQTATLKIAGWHSKGDALKTEAALKALAGVKSTTPDVPKKTIAVTFDDAAVTTAQLAKAIEGAGYSVVK